MEDLHKNTKLSNTLLLLLLFSTALLIFLFISGTTDDQTTAPELSLSRTTLLQVRKFSDDEEKARRKLIGSTTPTCTYNECRGCRYRCQAEQIPVDGNDPVNSAYRYKCVCHR